MAESLEREIRDLRDVLFSPRDPEGRGFAPLADALRRAGDLGQALEVAEEGVRRLPDFPTGHVVAGWVHRARGEDGDAEQSFRRVLELDEENVSALRGLGFLLAEAGGTGEALEVFRRLDELEPGDLEVRARLLELGGRAGSEVGGIDPGEAGEGAVLDIRALAPDAAEAAVVDILDLAPDAAEAAVVDILDLAPDDAEAEVVGIRELAPGAGGAGATDAREPMEEPAAEIVLDVGALAPDPGTMEAAVEPGGDGSDGTEAAAEMFEPWGVEEEAPDAGEAAAEPGEPWAVDAPPEAQPEAPEDDEPVAGRAEATDRGDGASAGATVAEEDTGGAADDDQGPWTRTMAELYAGQGSPERAARIYRHLVDQNPGDPALGTRLEQLQRALEGSGTAHAPGAATPASDVESGEASLEPGEDAEDALEELARHMAMGPDTHEEPEGPFAWGGAAVEEPGPGDVDEPSGPPVSEYLDTLLAWRPGGATRGSDVADREDPEGPAAGSQGGEGRDLPHRDDDRP